MMIKCIIGSALAAIVQKPTAIMVLPVFVMGILILGTLAATVHAQEGTIQPESNFTGNREETQIGNEHECFDEFAQLETCIANPENGATTQESSNTGNATEGANPQNGATTQESSNTGNATTEVANNPAPLQEMVPAFQITTKQLQNGLTEEKPAAKPASTNPDCNRTVCVTNAPHTGERRNDLAEQLNNGKKAFIFAVNGKTLSGIEDCDTMKYKLFSVKKDGVRYTICDTSTVRTFFGPTKPTQPGQIHGGLSGTQPFQNFPKSQ